jgi:hypothetical protein
MSKESKQEHLRQLLIAAKFKTDNMRNALHDAKDARHLDVEAAARDKRNAQDVNFTAEKQ